MFVAIEALRYVLIAKGTIQNQFNAGIMDGHIT